MARAILRIILVSGLLGIAASTSVAAAGLELHPLFERYCFGCHGNGKHKGDLTLDGWSSQESLLADRELWRRVGKALAHHQMPPEEKPQPTTAEREQLRHWIDSQVFQVDCDHPDPGRVTLRRLNRAEFNNTIRDLLGVDFQPADDFPVDDSGYGFDNIGDALSLSPLLMEKYFSAAQKILNAALGLHLPREPASKRYPVDLLEVGYNAKQQGNGWVALNSIEEDDVAVTCDVPVAAEYVVRVHAYARQEATNAMELTFMRDRIPAQTVRISTNQESSQVYEARLQVPAGRHRLRAVVRRIKAGLSPTEALVWKSGTQQKGAVHIKWLEISGPYRSENHPETYSRIFPREWPTDRSRAVREILERFATRAYRRPVTGRELDRLVGLFQSAADHGDSLEESVEVALQAVLVSPHFLFRGEFQPEPDNPRAVHPVNEYALASRLSYFLWSSMPDDELFELARQATLRTNLEAQVRRMLKAEGASSLADNFAGQWLQFRNLPLVTPDRDRFRAFDDSLRESMRRETEIFFQNIMRTDLSILDFLRADYTYVNERLARHYGLKEIKGEEFQRVSLQGTPRRGVLTHASVLTLTSNPTRTSPVKRGKWVLENLLNAPPPPPPPGVPELSEAKENVLSGTLRQRMEQHRADPLCASCHTRMDAIGFGLENFDAIGAWRELDGKFPIDATGELAPGSSFDGPVGLAVLLHQSRKEDFVQCLAEKMLTYALGRGLEYYDKCAVEKICEELAREEYRFSALILAIVRSAPFQLRRGDSMAPVEDGLLRRRKAMLTMRFQ